MEVIGEFRKAHNSTSRSKTCLLLCQPDLEQPNSSSRPPDHHQQGILVSSPLEDIENEGKDGVLKTTPLLTSPEGLLDGRAEICQASLELLSLEAIDEDKYFGLLTIVRRRRSGEDGEENVEFFSATLHLLESSFDNLTQSTLRDSVNLMDVNPQGLKVHILPSKEIEAAEETDDDGSGSGSWSECLIFRNQLIVLAIGEGITIYQVDTNPMPTTSNSKPRIVISPLIRVIKNFWWAEWNPVHQFLAFVHTQRRNVSLLESEENTEEKILNVQPILSVFQFHHEFPRETVLNFPLDSKMIDGSRNLFSSMISSPMILSTNTHVARSLRLLVDLSGSVCLFYLRKPEPSSLLSYTVILLAHNKTLTVDVPEDSISGDNGDNENAIIDVDVCLCRQGQYLIVLAWPRFLHILDIGVAHEPSHHFVFPLDSVFGMATIAASPRFQQICPGGSGNNSSIQLLFHDLSLRNLELSSSFFISTLRKYTGSHGSDLNLTLATIHAMFQHFDSPLAVRKLIGEMSKNVENLHLTKIFQEFIVSYAFGSIGKEVLPNMEAILHFIPYSPLPPLSSPSLVRLYSSKTYTMRLENNATKVSIMLLSPSQRISHHITDIWTCLWESNALLMSSHRFSHQKIAEKLLLSLQCYKPEALSRASTPMSPSSPMVCGSLTDIATMFARRTPELQLPFVEHETCTANKQEYIFSINLRELSMHLLKEKKDWPLACHTVAGKYVNALTDASRLLCHLISIATLPILQRPLRPKEKGFSLIDSLTSERQLTLYILMEHYGLAHGILACPLPQGFTPFFAYLGYRVLLFDKFLWHVRCGTFDLQIDMVKTIMAALSDSNEKDVEKKLQLISFLPKSRANRVLNGWSHPIAIGLRARQHASDLLSGAASGQSRKFHYAGQANRPKNNGSSSSANLDEDSNEQRHRQKTSALDTFFRLLTGKANSADIDLGLLAEATMLSMK